MQLYHFTSHYFHEIGINAQVIASHDESIQSQSSNPKSKSSSNISKIISDIYNRDKPTLDKSSMKSKFEFKFDIEEEK